MASTKSWPSYNAKNFSKFQPDSSDKHSAKKLSVYISTRDNTPQQVIKKDRSSILLRYLSQQIEKKNKCDDISKRKSPSANQDDVASTIVGEPRRKVPRSSEFRSSAANARALEDAIDDLE